ncbi:MAG: DUF5107 domain-containing protein [Bacteroidaceae bacterium]|nr:DUF5107 domain-containing protein [Bacteroidaceae bacterium]
MVKAWKEKVVIPTYEPGKPEKNPIFLEKRVYQGSSGVVYPYPVIESMSDEKVDKEYNVVWIENEYIKVMIMPELGGRVQMAYDKIAKRHFVYYNQVIKPALVGLAGPWISGGIEFNWPQHHRPSTFMPVDCKIEENSDGSVTVWVNEMERMFHQKGMAGFTLRPGCAYLEIKGVLYNRTEVPQTFLWWANPAVAVNDHYQSVFPQDVNAVFDHGKRAVSSFPIATGEYYKMDYSAGVDISNYKNIFVPTSYMAVNSKFNFEGGYENDTKAGMLHVANHHVSPGKKQWTWGNGDFGRAWDRNLTDEDGPYIELMAGVYTENQPDFSWLQPYEEKSFTQYFLPYRELGIVKNATQDLLFNIEKAADSTAILKLFATSKREYSIRILTDADEEIYSETTELSPEEVYVKEIDLKGNALNAITVEVLPLKGGRGGLTWHAESDEVKPIPDAAEAALLPHEIKTTEQLFLTGLHLEQYRHATYSPVDYYEEALRRDPIDVRCNNALGLWYIRKGQFKKAEPYLQTAVKTLQKRNPNPYDGEPIYNLGLCLKYQGRYSEAYDRFYKSTWNGAWQDAGYFACAQISAMQGRFEDALYEVERSLLRNWHNHKARALKAAVLRHLGRTDEALALIDDSLKIDAFNYGCLFEQCLLKKGFNETLKHLMRGESHNYDEVALDYCQAGLADEALALWNIAIEEGAVTPMTYYYMAWAVNAFGASCSLSVADLISKAEQQNFDFCFPNRPEAVLALKFAVETDREKTSGAAYLLGCLYYDKRQYDEAVGYWEMSRDANPQFPTVWRCLALAYFNKRPSKSPFEGDFSIRMASSPLQGDKRGSALHCMEKAFALDTSDARILMELDQLYKRLQRPHAERLAFLEQYPDCIAQRDDLILEVITLKNLTGKMQEAKEQLDAHIFHPWEGGEGKVPAQYQFARVELAKQLLATGGSLDTAIALLSECLEYPHHFGEGKLHNAQENDFYYFLGMAYRSQGNEEKAVEMFEKAAVGDAQPVAAMYYNDAKPDKIFYQGLALRALGREDKARSRFNALASYGEKHLFDKVQMDYFAVSLPDLLIWEDSLQSKNDIHCRYMMALGYYGLGQKDKALTLIHQLLQTDCNHLGIQQLKSFVEM